MGLFDFGGGGSGGSSGGSSNFGSYFWPSAILAATQLVGGLFQQHSAASEAKKAREQAERDSALAFERAKELKAMEPGPIGPFTGITDAQKVQAMQQNQVNDLDAISQLITAYQRGLLK